MALAVVGNCIERRWALGDGKRMGAGGNGFVAFPAHPERVGANRLRILGLCWGKM